MVKAINRVQIGPLVATEPYMTAEIVELPETYTESDRSLATARQIMVEFKRVFNMGKSIEFSLFMRLMGGVSAAELADQVANILEVKTSEKQEVLEILSVEDRLEKVLELLIHEIKSY